MVPRRSNTLARKLFGAVVGVAALVVFAACVKYAVPGVLLYGDDFSVQVFLGYMALGVPMAVLSLLLFNVPTLSRTLFGTAVGVIALCLGFCALGFDVSSRSHARDLQPMLQRIGQLEDYRSRAEWEMSSERLELDLYLDPPVRVPGEGWTERMERQAEATERAREGQRHRRERARERVAEFNRELGSIRAEAKPIRVKMNSSHDWAVRSLMLAVPLGVLSILLLTGLATLSRVVRTTAIELANLPRTITVSLVRGCVGIGNYWRGILDEARQPKNKR